MAPIFDQVQGIASALLAELCCRLSESDHPVCRCSFAFGDPPPVDFCCDCTGGQGQAWVRVGPVVPATNFPIQDEVVSRCEFGTFAATFTLGIYRCAPTLGDNGEPPSATEIATALTIQLQDRALLAQVIRCALREDVDDHPWLMGPWGPIDPQGGCMGSSISVAVGVADCLDCPPCPTP